MEDFIILYILLLILALVAAGFYFYCVYLYAFKKEIERLTKDKQKSV